MIDGTCMECSDADGSRHTEIVLRRGCLGHQEKLDSSSWISTDHLLRFEYPQVFDAMRQMRGIRKNAYRPGLLPQWVTPYWMLVMMSMNLETYSKECLGDCHGFKWMASTHRPRKGMQMIANPLRIHVVSNNALQLRCTMIQAAKLKTEKEMGDEQRSWNTTTPLSGLIQKAESKGGFEVTEEIVNKCLSQLRGHIDLDIQHGTTHWSLRRNVHNRAFNQRRAWHLETATGELYYPNHLPPSQVCHCSLNLSTTLSYKNGGLQQEFYKLKCLLKALAAEAHKSVVKPKTQQTTWNYWEPNPSELRFTREVFEQYFHKIDKYIDVKTLLPHLIQYGIITSDDFDWTQPRKHEIYKIVSKRKNGYMLLYRALRETKYDHTGHKEVVHILEETARLMEASSRSKNSTYYVISTLAKLYVGLTLYIDS